MTPTGWCPWAEVGHHLRKRAGWLLLVLEVRAYRILFASSLLRVDSCCDGNVISKKKIFISYDYDNDRSYKSLLLAWDANDDFDFEFYDESVDVSVDSDDAAAIRRVISTRIGRSSHFICLIGSKIHKSDWVAWEIEKAVELKKKLVAVKIKDTYLSPAEILGVGASWAKSFTFGSIKNAIEAA